VNRTPPSHQSPATPTRSTLRGRSLVLSSSEDVLTAFLFFYIREPAALISWVIAQQAFNCSMILLLDALETGDISRIRRVEQAYAIFKELEDNHVHKLASMAVEKISWGLEELRKSIEASGPRPRDSTTDMQAAGQDDARRDPERLRDTVMGNTGMFSLEEPGLQSFTPEAFAPFAWSSAGTGIATPPLVQLKEEQESPPQNETKPLSKRKLRESRDRVPIASVLHNGRSPQGSAPSRSVAPASQEHALLEGGVTVSSVPKCPAVSAQQHHGRYQHVASEYDLHQRTYPPHSPNYNSSTPQFPERRWGQDKHENTAAVQGERRTPPMAHQDRPPMSSPQPPHNSHPLLHRSPTTAPPSRPNFPSHTGPAVHDITGSTHPDIHIPWAEPTAPTQHSIAHGMTFMPVSTHSQVLPQYQHGVTHYQHMAYQSPSLGQTSDPTNASLAASHMEQMTVEEWRRWMSSNGAV
jgi:hypothetical protein